MEKYMMEVCGLKRELPYIPIDEETAFASFVILGDVELIGVAAEELVKKLDVVDYIVTAEAKGIPLSYEMSRRLGLKECIILRKSVKTYMKEPMCQSVKSITTVGSQNLYLDQVDAEKINGKNICIVDDVISTGESLKAIENLVIRAGGIVRYKVAILAEGDAAKRDDIVYLGVLPIFSKCSDGTYIKK